MSLCQQWNIALLGRRHCFNYTLFTKNIELRPFASQNSVFWEIWQIHAGRLVFLVMRAHYENKNRLPFY